MPAGSGRYPSGQRGQTVNLLAYAFGGSNPPLPTIAAGAARPDSPVGGLRQTRPGFVVAGAARPDSPVGGLSQTRPGFVVAGAACSGSIVGGLRQERGGSVALTNRLNFRRDTPVWSVRHDISGGNSSAVERQPSKLGVAGSNPVSRSIVSGAARPVFTAGGLRQVGPGCVDLTDWIKFRGGDVDVTDLLKFGVRPTGRNSHVDSAHVAQSAERVLGKDEVSGSIPDMGSSSRYAIVTVNGRC